jgi:hypothetical protein
MNNNKTTQDLYEDVLKTLNEQKYKGILPDYISKLSLDDFFQKKNLHQSSDNKTVLFSNMFPMPQIKPGDPNIYTLIFYVNKQYSDFLLKLLISIIYPNNIYGLYTFDDTLSFDTIRLYFVFPLMDELTDNDKKLDYINNYIMLILSNISENLISNMGVDCVFSDYIQCGPTNTLPINKLMYFLQGPTSEQRFYDTQKTYLFRDYPDLKTPYYEKKYYKYKLKYKLLKNTKI